MAVQNLSIQRTFLNNGILPALIRTNALKERTSFMEEEQATLIRLRALDPQAITKVHNAYFPIVYRYTRYRLGDEVVAEDLASEAFIRLLEALHAGRGPNASLRGWLMRTASNLVNDYYRAAYNKPTESLDEAISTGYGDPVSHSERSDQREALRMALSKLTSKQQHVLALRFGSGCSLTETAEIMRKKTNAVKQLQFRALAALRNNISGLSNERDPI
jgi:RNA polymerase sigma-70 factor (ECF subfamily)